jgi:hypothetical protein
MIRFIRPNPAGQFDYTVVVSMYEQKRDVIFAFFFSLTHSPFRETARPTKMKDRSGRIYWILIQFADGKFFEGKIWPRSTVIKLFTAVIYDRKKTECLYVACISSLV